MSDLFGKAGRAFLATVTLPAFERQLLDADLRTIDFLDGEIATVERSMAKVVQDDPDVRRLLSVPGIALTAAVGLRAAIGDISRFKSPGNLVSYFGLNPSVYQSGLKAYTGHISRRGRSHARSVCIEVAHQLAMVPGPLRAFFVRLRRRKPYNVAITAVARKLVVLVWHMLTRQEDYHYAPPALTREKRGKLRRLATGERAARTSQPVPDRTLDREPGRSAEADYVNFISERFGPNGPTGVEHPNRHPLARGGKPTSSSEEEKKPSPRRTKSPGQHPEA